MEVWVPRIRRFRAGLFKSCPFGADAEGGMAALCDNKRPSDDQPSTLRPTEAPPLATVRRLSYIVLRAGL